MTITDHICLRCAHQGPEGTRLDEFPPPREWWDPDTGRHYGYLCGGCANVVTGRIPLPTDPAWAWRLSRPALD